MGMTVRAPAYVAHGRQFVDGWPTGLCTLASLAACDIAAKGKGALVAGTDPASVANYQALMIRFFKDALAFKDCAPNGAMTQAGAIRTAKRNGLPVKDILPFRADMPEDLWIAFLRKYAGGDTPRPILVQVANGRALRDANTGAADEAGLNEHAIALVGTVTDPERPAAGGYIGSDSDNANANAGYVVYNLETLRAARPNSMIAFDFVPYEPKPAPPIVPAPPVKVPPPVQSNQNAVTLTPAQIAAIRAAIATLETNLEPKVG